ncbi:hypothetical protein NDU88_001619 [Pleurodeles waltl]|uniref:Uncharacterized protein n=1 Tax=Pleurodeles waltl TaxID=8319 RepID=A0AAV7SA85_PLEWA|nr:hypothetical protein NDU88_001619 [Pleurodeles waltl]
MSERQTPEDAVFFNEQEDLLQAEVIVHSLDGSVAQSVNRALAVVLQPIASQLKRYALTVPPFGNPMPLSSRSQEASPPPGPEWPYSEHMARLSQSQSPFDHQHLAQLSTSTQALSYPSPDDASDASSSQSGYDNWIVLPTVTDYAHAHIRKTLDQDIRSHLQSECPRPDIPDKVAMTAELDQNLAIFLKQSTKDPKKGIDRSCQYKVLDLSGPLCKILDLAVAAKESGSQVDPDTLAGWALRALCLLGCSP